MAASTRSPLAVASWICLLAAFVYLLSYAGTLHAVDEHSALSVAESMLLGQGFHANQMEWDQARTPPQNAFGLDGNLYSKKGIGVSLLALPLFGLGEVIAGPVGAAQVALLTGSLLTLLAIWAMFWLAHSMSYPLSVAVLAALLLAFGSPLWPYTRTLFSETPGATGLALALWGMVAWRHQRRTAWLLLAGSGLALVILVKSSNGVVVPLFGIYWLWETWQRKQAIRRRALLGELAAWGAPVLLAVAATVAYNYVRFGTTFGFPLESFEVFSTPLPVGLAGLLLSSGKGIFWYFPALWLGVVFIPRWRMGGRLADYLLAAGAALALIVVYALWYDWPGGRAWGPRMIITATPALAMLVLPALDWLVSALKPQGVAEENGHEGAPTDPHVSMRTGQSMAYPDEDGRTGQSTAHPLNLSPTQPRVGGRARQVGLFLVVAVLLISVAVQLPGVLVNFERQEELDMQAGATFDQLLWSPALSPLLTYWQRIGTAPDPLWLQPYLRVLPPAWLLALVGAVTVAAGGLALAAWQIIRQRTASLWLVLAGLAVALLALMLPALAYADPRWDEQSAVLEDNRAIMRSVQEAWQGGDVVLLDLLESSDKGRRTGQWLNFARREPYIGWLRKSGMGGATGEQLAAWLLPYRRVWLLLQATDEGEAASTTEAWLNEWAFGGRRWWVGDQRVVEYLLPRVGMGGEQPNALEMPGPFSFGEQAVLDYYQLVGEEQDESGAGVLLTLHWQSTGDADTRYSVQALSAGNNVLAQVDGSPGAVDGQQDRVGLWLPAAVDKLILKVYRASDGSILQVLSPTGAEAADYLSLTIP